MIRRALLLLVCAGLAAFVFFRNDGRGAGPSDVAPELRPPAEAQAATVEPVGDRRETAGARRTRAPESHQTRRPPPVPTGTRRRGDHVPFHHLIAHRTQGLLQVEVVDTRTRRHVPACTFRWEQPGTLPLAGTFKDGTGVVRVRTGMAGNLYIQAKGYRDGARRQVRLTTKHDEKRVVIALEMVR